MVAMAEKVTVKCAWCEKEIQRLACQIKGKDNIFCCRECMWKFNGAKASAKVERIEVNCANCGKVLLKRPCDFKKVKGDNHFCSRKCRGEFERTTFVFKCDWCGKDVCYPQSHSERSERHFCSTDCRAAWQSDNVRGGNHPLYSKIKVKCAICNKEIERKKSEVQKKRSHFCSKKCFDVFNRSEENRDIQRKRMLKTLSTYPRRTAPEKAIKGILDDLGIKHCEQYVINNRFCVDFLVGNIVIEVFGDYFHANPVKYGDGIDRLQKKNIMNDKRKLSYLNKCGYKIIVVWENDINNDIDKIREQIKEICKLAV
jgi:very-short-patch-repair endonuclease/endogenous inhibitor of DNA gyrase (YacG/DUF329 family)